LIDAAIGTFLSPFDPAPYEFDYGKVPIASRFIKSSTYGSTIRSDYRAIRQSVENVKAEMKAMETKNVPTAVYQKQKKIRQPILALVPMLKTADAQMNKFSRLKKKIENNPRYSETEKIQRVDDIDRKQLKLMIRINKKAKSVGYKV